MSQRSMRTWWICCGVVTLGCAMIIATLVKTRDWNPNDAGVTKLPMSSAKDQQSSASTDVTVRHLSGDALGGSSGSPSKSVEDTNIGSDVKFIDDQVTRKSLDAADQALFEAKYHDPRNFVTLRFYNGMPYKESRRLISKENLPLLYDMLADKTYAPYWHNVARLIGNVSNDPNSVAILLDYFQRDDGSNISSIGGKVWSLALIGQIGGAQADSILQQAVTEQGAEKLASAWIDKELWPEKNWSRAEVLDYIRNAVMLGLIYTDKPQNAAIVQDLYKQETARFKTDGKPTKLFAYTIDSMAAKAFIAEHGLEAYLDLRAEKRVQNLWPYLRQYGPSPPEN